MSVDWVKWRKLTQIIEKLPARKILMKRSLFGNAPTAGAALNHECSTVGCIRGYEIALFAPETAMHTVPEYAQNFSWSPLGMSPREASWVYTAQWDSKMRSLALLKKTHVVRYMRAALKQKNILISV